MAQIEAGSIVASFMDPLSLRLGSTDSARNYNTGGETPLRSVYEARYDARIQEDCGAPRLGNRSFLRRRTNVKSGKPDFPSNVSLPNPDRIPNR